jgi:hypothetical protein
MASSSLWSTIRIHAVALGLIATTRDTLMTSKFGKWFWVCEGLQDTEWEFCISWEKWLTTGGKSRVMGGFGPTRSFRLRHRSFGFHE